MKETLSHQLLADKQRELKNTPEIEANKSKIRALISKIDELKWCVEQEELFFNFSQTE